MIRKIFNWIFKAELATLKLEINEAQSVALYLHSQKQAFDSVLNGIDVSVDVHEHHRASSWAVISLQGQRSDFVKFIDLRGSDMDEIRRFLRRYERHHNIKTDASPQATAFLQIKRPYPRRGYGY